MSEKPILAFGDATYDPTSDAIDFDLADAAYRATLLRFVEDTLAECPFYAERAPRTALREPADFHALPLLDAGQLRAITPLDLLPQRIRARLVSEGAAGLTGDDRIVRIAQSTSSSGAPPKVAFYTRADWRASASLWQRIQPAMTDRVSLRVLNCFHPGHGMGRYLDEVVGGSGSIVVNRHHASASIADDVAQLGSGLRELGGFDTLAAPAWSPNKKAKGASLDLLLNADVDNVIGRQIRLVITAGAPLDNENTRIRERLRDAAELAGNPPPEIRELYGGSEVGIAAASCASGALHFFTGPVFGEVVDPDGQPTPDGEIGLVAVTSLRHGSRYLRYLIGDQARVHRGRCDCGRVSARLTEIGRIVEPERLQSGCAAGDRA